MDQVGGGVIRPKRALRPGTCRELRLAFLKIKFFFQGIQHITSTSRNLFSLFSTGKSVGTNLDFVRADGILPIVVLDCTGTATVRDAGNLTKKGNFSKSTLGKFPKNSLQRVHSDFLPFCEEQEPILDLS